MIHRISKQTKVFVRLLEKMAASPRLGQTIKNGGWHKYAPDIKWQPPKNTELNIIEFENFSAELLKNKTKTRKKVVYQIHGGGFIMGYTNSYRRWSAMYARYANADVFSIDYRLAPEHPYPSALEDVIDGYKWLLERYKAKNIIIAGDSAGGGLALSLIHYLKKNCVRKPSKMVLMSPWTDLTISGKSIKANFDKDPFFGGDENTMVFRKDYMGEHNPRNPLMSPLFGNFKDFPKMLIQVGSSEMLFSDSFRVYNKAKVSGCDVELSVFEGMFHIFQMANNTMKESRDAWREIKYFVR